MILSRSSVSEDYLKSLTEALTKYQESNGKDTTAGYIVMGGVENGALCYATGQTVFAPFISKAWYVILRMAYQGHLHVKKDFDIKKSS